MRICFIKWKVGLKQCFFCKCFKWNQEEINLISSLWNSWVTWLKLKYLAWCYLVSCAISTYIGHLEKRFHWRLYLIHFLPNTSIFQIDFCWSESVECSQIPLPCHLLSMLCLELGFLWHYIGMLRWYPQGLSGWKAQLSTLVELQLTKWIVNAPLTWHFQPLIIVFRRRRYGRQSGKKGTSNLIFS